MCDGESVMTADTWRVRRATDAAESTATYGILYNSYYARVPWLHIG